MTPAGGWGHAAVITLSLSQPEPANPPAVIRPLPTSLNCFLRHSRAPLNDPLTEDLWEGVVRWVGGAEQRREGGE